MSAPDKGGDDSIVVKKYANRRLYNTAASSYVTLDHLARLTQEGVDFVVYDAKTNEDITRSVLTQIIVEEEAKGENLLPVAFLRQLITFYGDNMRWMVPQYLEQMMQSFAENQDRMRDAMQDAMGNLFPFGNLEDMQKQNMAFLENAMRVWSPFAVGQAGPPAPGAAPAAPGVPGREAEDLARLKSEVQALKSELEELSTKPKNVPVASPEAKAAPSKVTLPAMTSSAPAKNLAEPPKPEPKAEAASAPAAKSKEDRN